MKNKYVVSVILAGSLWGFMGFFRRTLDTMGVSAISCIAVRCVFAAVLFGIVLLISDRKAFKIRLKDAWIFLGSGIVSLLIFGVCYFKAMDYMSLSAAAILLYTAPCFVILFSALLFKEKLTGQKLIAMVLAFAGCCLVSGIGGGGAKITPIGLALGLTAGVCYALYSIFGRFALNRGYSSLTINFYSCLLAAVLVTDKSAYMILNALQFPLSPWLIAIAAAGPVLFLAAKWIPRKKEKSLPTRRAPV